MSSSLLGFISLAILVGLGSQKLSHVLTDKRNPPPQTKTSELLPVPEKKQDPPPVQVKSSKKSPPLKEARASLPDPLPVPVKKIRTEVVSLGPPKKAPIKELSAPTFARQLYAVELTDQPSANVELSWDPHVDAEAYMVEASDDKEFNSVFKIWNIQAPSVQWNNILPGNYFVKVSALDKHGLKGRTSQPMEVSVALPAPDLDGPPSMTLGEKSQLSWTSFQNISEYELLISRTPSFTVSWTFHKKTNDHLFHAKKLSTYYWKVRALGKNRRSLSKFSKVGVMRIEQVQRLPATAPLPQPIVAETYVEPQVVPPVELQVVAQAEPQVVSQVEPAPVPSTILLDVVKPQPELIAPKQVQNIPFAPTPVAPNPLKNRGRFHFIPQIGYSGIKSNYGPEKAVLGSKLNKGFNLQYQQVWSHSFETALYVNVMKTDFEQPAPKTLEADSHNLTDFGFITKWKPSERSGASLSFGNGQELFIRGISANSMTLDRVALPRAGTAAWIDLVKSENYTLGVRGNYTYLFPSKTVNYNIKPGNSYRGTVYLKDELSETLQIISGISYESARQNTSIVNHQKLSLGLEFGLLWSFGK